MPRVPQRVGRISTSNNPRDNQARLRRVVDFINAMVKVDGDFILGDVTIGRGGGSVYTNAAIGRNALGSNTTGSRNFAAGNEASASNTTGSDNCVAGNEAHTNNVSGAENTVYGNQAMYSDTASAYCTAIGSKALYHQDNSSGISTAVGRQACFFNTQGYHLTGIGNGALYSNDNGIGNTGVGHIALAYNVGGDDNCAFGKDAGSYQADGVTQLTATEQSIYIGSGARGYDNSDSNSIVIGYQAIGEGANTTVIGNSSTTAAHIYGRQSSSGLTISGPTATTVPLVVQTTDNNQTNATTEWRLSNGTVVASIGAYGAAVFNEFGVASGSFRVESASSEYMLFLDANLNTVLINGNTDLGATLGVTSYAAGDVTVVVKAHASQTANLQEWHNSSGSVLASVGPSGNAVFNEVGMSVDFRVESLNFTNMLRVAGASDGVFVNSAADLGSTFGVVSSTAADVATIIKGASSQTGDLQQWRDSSNTILLSVQAGGHLSFDDGVNVVLDTTTGTKFGTSSSQKLSLWNATPIVQPTTAISAATFAANTSAISDDTATFDGYTIGQVVKALRNVGLLA